MTTDPFSDHAIVRISFSGDAEAYHATRMAAMTADAPTHEADARLWRWPNGDVVTDRDLARRSMEQRAMATDEQASMIQVWRYWDAPEALRALSDHGGDEDWIVVVPATLDDLVRWSRWIAQIDTGGEPQRVERSNGTVVYIGAHA